MPSRCGNLLWAYRPGDVDGRLTAGEGWGKAGIEVGVPVRRSEGAGTQAHGSPSRDDDMPICPLQDELMLVRLIYGAVCSDATGRRVRDPCRRGSGLIGQRSMSLDVV